MKRLLMALGACMCALGLFAGVIYVTPDGAGSGASWADPAGLTAGFEQAVAAGGGEIWLKAGTYRMSGAAGLTACSNLVVRGGFAGDETSADAADPKAHATILSGEGSGCGWTVDGERPAADSEDFVPLWKDGEFIVARADDVVATYRNPYTTSRTSGLKAPFISSEVPVTGLKIVGITFTANICSPAIDLPEGSDFEIDGCRFLACGCDMGAIGNGVLSTAGRVTMRNTDVIGCPCPIYLTGTAADATNRIVNCRFEDNTGLFKDLSGGAITALGGQPLEVSGCTFLRNTGFSQGNGSSTYPAAAISCRDGALTLTDSVFEGNRVRNAGNAPYATVAFKNATIARCLFKGNTLLSVAHQANSLDIYSAGICHSGGYMLVRDTVFAGNTCTVQTDYTRAGICWTSAVAANSECGQFYNCSFYSNRTEVVVTDDALVGLHLGSTVKAYRKVGKDTGLGLAFVNCLFSDNELAGNVTGVGEIAVDNSDKSQFTLALINSVIWNEQTDYPVFYKGANFPVNISHSDVVGYTGAPATNKNDYVEYATAVDPTVAAKAARPRGSYPFKGMLGLSKTSAFAKCARPIYESEGVLYFYAPGMVSGSPWRKCTSRGTNLAELDAGDPLPDAFGGDRTEGQICYGPALTDPLGLMLMLK